MKIKKLITINWANLENKEYPLTDIVFLTGETGVGKSTLLDAIQTIMTASHSSIVKYNAGQDETEKKQRGKKYRTLGGYFLGEDRGLFSRPFESTGTIVLTFVSSPNEPDKVLNAIINTKCSLVEQNGERDAYEDSIHFFLVKNNELSIDDIYSIENGKKKVLLGDELFQNLRAVHGKENVISLGNKKEEYLSYLYGNLWNKSVASSKSAIKAARAFAKFIHAKPVDNINSFIKNEFLESKGMKSEISKLSTAIRTLKEMKDESDEIENGINELNNIAKKISSILGVWEKNKKEHYIFATIDYKNQEIKSNDIKEQFIKYHKEIEDKENESKILMKQAESLQEDLITLKGAANSNTNYLNYQNIEAKIGQQKKKLQEIKIDVFYTTATNLKQRVRNELSKLIELEDFEKEKLLIRPLLESIERLLSEEIKGFGMDTSVDSEDFKILFPILVDIIKDISNIHKKLIDSEGFVKIFNGHKEDLEKITFDYKKADEKLGELNIQIKEIEHHKSFTPKNIQEELQILKNELPDCNPSFINKYIEIKPEETEWGEAIEGFIKNNRFAVIVNSEYEYKAIEAVKTLKLNNIKIVQGKKMLKTLDTKGDAVRESSIINKLTFTNEIARAYLINNYGNVLCLEDEYEIKNSDRAITKDGKASNGGLMFYCKAKELVFGEGSLLLTLQKLKAEAEVMANNNKSLRNKMTDIQGIVRIFDIVKSQLKFNDNFSYEEYKNHLNEYTKTRDLLKTIDKSDFEQIESQIEKTQMDIEEITNKNAFVLRELGAFTQKIENKHQIIQNEQNILQSKKSKLELKEQEYFGLLQVITPSLKLDIEKDKISQQIKDIDSYEEPNELKVDIVDYWADFKDYYIKSSVFESKQIYYSENQNFAELSVGFERFNQLVIEKEKTISEITRLSNTMQMKYREQIATHEKEVKEIFVNSFCSSIYRNIKNCKLEIEEFTDKLRGHKFENESFIIEVKEAEPEFEEYKKYFQYIAENQDSISENSLFSNNQAKEELAQTKNKLFEMFIKNEEYQSELQRISDYRNYAKYDILQVVDGRGISLSKNGKNSGGQGETSYYIVRSINLHSALNPAEANGSTLESLIIDESFLKINDTRAKEILNYLNKTLGFQIICALPTKSANVLNELEASNYHIVKQHTDKKVGELDYTTWARHSKRNTKEIKMLYKSKHESLFAESSKEAMEEYNATI